MDSKHNGFREFLTSMRLAVVLLGVIALGALLGTIIPQQAAAEAFAARLHPALLAVFKALQLFDVYHSTWFVLLLVLLAVNLTACSLDRFPAAWRQFRGGAVPDGAVPLNDLPAEWIVVTDKPVAEEASRLAGETKTESIRKALEERLARLRLRVVKRDREAEVLRYLEREVWPSVPRGVLGRRLTRREEDQVLGYGKEGA